jgi:hypothetical protein
VLNFYDGEILNHARLSDVLHGNDGNPQQFNLNRGDRGDIVAFLRTLTDQALVTDAKFSNPFIEVADEQPVVIDDSTTLLAHLSTQARLNNSDDLIISGFVIEGSGSKILLIRGIGPELITFGVDDALATPALTPYSGTTTIATNTDWRNASNATQIAQVAESIGAFPLSTTRADSAILTSVILGAYTVHLTSADSSSGTGLIEIYDDDSLTTARLINLSSRIQVAPGGVAIVPGFVVSGDTPTTILIRAIGPSLRQFGVTDARIDPQLTVFSENNLIISNDNWFVSGTSAQTESAAAEVGAFAIDDSTLDA